MSILSKTQTTFCSMPSMLIAIALATAPSLFAEDVGDKQPREQIGESLGKPIYRDDIRTENNATLASELHRLFLSAAMEEYRAQHDMETTPTVTEIAAARKYYDGKHGERMEKEGPALREKLKAIEMKLGEAEINEVEKTKLVNEKRYVETLQRPPGEMFAAWTVKNWKFQQHLYKKYGRGRLLWQQAGVEAFDATRQWLESLETAGKFKITDPKLRSSLYEYWTRDHGHWIIDDEERIQDFVEPEFLQTPSTQELPTAHQTDASRLR